MAFNLRFKDESYLKPTGLTRGTHIEAVIPDSTDPEMESMRRRN
jgi:hypothetical protein